MIASADPQQPRFSQPQAAGHRLGALTPRRLAVLAGRAAVLAGCAALLAGCANDRQTTLLRSSRARAVGELRAEREQQERELALWQKTREEALEETASVRFDAVRASSVLRTVQANLDRELSLLQRSEQNLLDALQRGTEIEVELKPLRALEQQLLDQQAEIKKANERVQALAAELAVATAAVSKQETTLQPKLEALQKRLAVLKTVGVTIAEVDALVAAAQKALAPASKPAKKPAAKPATKPKK